MKTLKQLLGTHPRQPLAVAPDESVYVALKLMAEHNIGAVLVMKGDRLAGIFSERDYARKIILHDRSSKETLIREIMTEKVLCASPEQTTAEAMTMMTEKHIRHLPVRDGNHKIIGIVSIGDLVKETIAEQTFLIQQLEQYIVS